MFSIVGNILGSGTAKSGLSFALSGMSFAAANLILAHYLTVHDYGVFSLLIAVVMLMASIGMLGADGVVNRHAMTPDVRVFVRVALSSISIALLGALMVVYTYQIPAALAALLVPTGVAFAMTRFCGAYLQSKYHLVSSLLFANSLNYLVLVVALLAAFGGLKSATIPFVVMSVLQCAIAVGAVILVRNRFRTVSSSYKYSWRESLAIVFMVSSSGLLVQLERLVTPALLELEDLAVLGVLLAIVGPPFRLLQLTFGYDLLPSLIKGRRKGERLALLLKQTIVAFSLMLPLWLIIWFGVPLIQRLYLSDEYAMSNQLILAALVAGTIKGFSGIAQASITAMSSTKGMEIMGAIGWVSVLCAVLAASFGAQFGLAGVVYGVAVGWVMRLVATPFIVRRWPENVGRATDTGSHTEASPIILESRPDRRRS